MLHRICIKLIHLFGALFLYLSCTAIASAASDAALPHSTIVDCSKAKDPARCEARIAARTACKDKRGADKRACMNNHAVPPDCSKAAKPEQCTLQQEAEHYCQKQQFKKKSAYKACLKNWHKKHVSKPSMSKTTP